MVACLFFLLPRAQGRDDRLLVPRLALAFSFCLLVVAAFSK